MELKSERMDTAYPLRFHEEELSATASRILLRMVESESFLDSTRRMVESWVFAKRGIVRLAASGGWNVIVRQMRRGCDWLAVAWRLKDGCGWVEVPDGYRGWKAVA